MKKNLIAYIVLVYLASIPFYYFISNTEVNIRNMIYGLMWMPAVVGILVAFFSFKKEAFKFIGFFRFGKTLDYILALFVPIVVCLIVYGFAWITGLSKVDINQLARANESWESVLFYAVTIGLLFSLLTATGEEIGWRGVMTPLSMKAFTHNPYFKTAILMAIVWGSWHAPLIFSGQYSSGKSIWFTLPAFLFNITVVSFILTTLRLSSGTFWPAALFHASHNLFVQAIFDVITIDASGYGEYVTTEFGFGLGLVYMPVALYLAYKFRQNGGIEREYDALRR